MNKELENYILGNEHYHHLFTNVYDEIELIKEKINESPFLDIILEFYDFKEISKLVNDIPEDHSNKKLIESYILSDYLHFKILENLELDSYDKDDLKKGLYSGSFDKYKDINDHPIWMFLDQDLKKLANDTNKIKARCHFFIDSVDSVRLQQTINGLYTSRTTTVMMAYTKKDNLQTYYSITGDLMEDPHDYVTHRLKK